MSDIAIPDEFSSPNPDQTTIKYKLCKDALNSRQHRMLWVKAHQLKEKQAHIIELAEKGETKLDESQEKLFNEYKELKRYLEMERPRVVPIALYIMSGDVVTGTVKYLQADIHNGSKGEYVIIENSNGNEMGFALDTVIAVELLINRPKK